MILRKPHKLNGKKKKVERELEFFKVAWVSSEISEAMASIKKEEEAVKKRQSKNKNSWKLKL